MFRRILVTAIITLCFSFRAAQALCLTAFGLPAALFRPLYVTDAPRSGGVLGIMFNGEGPPNAARVRVVRVYDDTPAREAGFEPGDVILTYNDQPVFVNSLKGLISDTPPGATVSIKVRRDESVVTLHPAIGDVRLVDGPTRESSEILGMVLLEATAVRGATPHPGLLVAGVTEGSPAHRAGLRAGDFIVAIDDETPDAPETLRRRVRYARAPLPFVLSVEKDASITFFILAPE